MNLRKIVLLAVIVLLTVSLTGCTYSFGFFMNKIVRPPRLEGEQQELQLAFENSVGKDVIMKSPARGKYLSSFVSYDINGDGTEEVFVFYAYTSAENTVRVNILNKVDGEWVSTGDFKGSGSSVYEIEFVDVNLDGKSEIIISWSLFESKTAHIISIIDFSVASDGTMSFTAKANEYFTYKELIDFDLDGYYELCLLFIDNTTDVPQPYLRVFKFSESNSITLVSELLLDSNITAVSETRKDIVTTAGGDCTRLFIDVARGDSGLFTEVVMWSKESNKLIRLLDNPSTDTYRNISLNCLDINGDGFYEIPVIARLSGSRNYQLVSGSEETNDAVYIDLIQWLSVNGYAISDDSVYTVYYPKASMLFKLEWNPDDITVKYDSAAVELVFVSWDSENQKYKDNLFAIKYTSDVSEILSGYTLISSGDSGNYWCKLYSAGEELGITAKSITLDLIILN